MNKRIKRKIERKCPYAIKCIHMCNPEIGDSYCNKNKEFCESSKEYPCFVPHITRYNSKMANQKEKADKHYYSHQGVLPF